MEAAAIVLRLVAFASGAALFGAPLLFLYGVDKTVRPPVGLRHVLMVAALATTLAAAVALVVQTGQMAGDPAAGLDPATLRDVLTSAGFGRSILVRATAGASALVLLLALRETRDLGGLSSALGALALGALAWSGHGAATDGHGGLLHTTADVIHLLAAGSWLGALLSFSLLLAAAARKQTSPSVVQAALEWFSGVGSGLVAALIATGLVNSWFLIGPAHLGELANSRWGQLLVAKLVLFAIMLAFAALNRFLLTPRLKAALEADPAAALAALRRSVTVESAVGLAVLALVAALGVLAPPASF